MIRPLVAIVCSLLAAAALEAQQDLATTFRRTLEDLKRDTEQMAREQAADPNYQAHRRGDEQRAAGNFEAAIREYETALELVKDDQVAYWKIGSVLAQMGRFDEAIELYQKSISANVRGEVWPWAVNYELGYAYGRLGRFAEAESALTASLAANPTANAYGARGRIKLARDELAFDAALADYDAALGLSPNSIPTLVAKAEALLLRDASDEDFENACAALVKACDLGECRPLDEFSECSEDPADLDSLFEERN